MAVPGHSRLSSLERSEMLELNDLVGPRRSSTEQHEALLRRGSDESLEEEIQSLENGLETRKPINVDSSGHGNVDMDEMVRLVSIETQS